MNCKKCKTRMSRIEFQKKVDIVAKKDVMFIEFTYVCNRCETYVIKKYKEVEE